MPLTVRKAVDTDLFGIFKLCVFMHQETDFAAFGFNPQKCLNSLTAWINAALMLVAVREVDGSEEIVGMMAASKKNPWFSDDIMVSEDFFYVREDARGSRAAYLLMKGFRQWADEVGAQHLRAGVATGCGYQGAVPEWGEDGRLVGVAQHTPGSPAERLYQKFGMQYVGGNFSAHISRSAA